MARMKVEAKSDKTKKVSFEQRALDELQKLTDAENKKNDSLQKRVKRLKKTSSF